ncbi:Efflux ABC transporter, permease/ATP-binding protein [hydrothermal vent metagenome]|uniref:Efflux ABC transporter, permease/ATP-binding protein n=1 Tax=hydrothermal vent metagenome TaxID=652676 RepID=A0A3B1BQB1_9ZZZZ
MSHARESVFAKEGKTQTDSTGYDWGYILTVAKEHRRDLILAHIVAILAVLASVPIPLLMPLLVDEVLLHKPATLVGVINGLFPPSWQGPVLYISAILLLTICLRLTGLLLGVWQTMRFTLVAKDVTYRMRRGLLARLQTISMAEYETLGSGAVSSRFVTDLNVIDEFVGASLSKTLVSVLSLIGISAILLWMHWQLALFILLMNPLVIYFTVALGKGVKQLKKKENSAFEVFQQALVETLDGIHEIRAGNRERHYLGRVMAKAKKIKEHSAAFSWKADAAGRFSFGIFLIGFDIFRAISMLMVVYSNLSVGEMMAVFGYLWFMMGPVQEVLNIQYAWYAAKAAMHRINQLFELQQEPKYPHLHNPFSGKQTVGIEVRDICFSYGQDSETVLRHVNLDIRPAETVALVGASGGGKSTLVQVLLGMYPAQQGMLYFDGVPVTEIGLDVVRDNVATVMQHPAMFNDSVRQNLTLGLDIVDEILWQALEIAQLRDVVKAMPEGLETIVGRQGVRLSGGQRQRLAIARMLLSKPRVVILDEATSALDTATEARLHAAMHDFLQMRTTLIIAHRLSAVKQADRVYVFENGHIIEEGVHEDLIRSNGLYSRLYGHQQETEG